MALGDYTLPLGDDEENNQLTRNAATPFIDLANTDQFSQDAGGQFDPTVTPEMMAQLDGGQPPPDPSAQLSQAPAAPDVATPQAQQAPVEQQGAPTAPQAPQEAAPAGAETPAPPGAAAPPEQALQPLGPPPAPPALTGDPTKDVQQNLLYHRQLTDYQAQAAQHAQALEQRKAAIEGKKADRELAIEQNAATIRNDEAARYAEERQKRQAGIDEAVGERVKAYKDLSEGNGFLDQSLGDTIIGALLFAFGDKQAALRNTAAAQLGQASNFENNGLKTIEGIMQRRYQQKLQRIKAASDEVLEARYGAKDAAENHRAALNDLDADLAANYRLAGKEAEQQLRQRGADAATVAGNAVVAGLYQKAADAEAQIHEREEELGVKRESAAAQNKLAEAHLDLSERQLQATKEQQRNTNAEAWARIRDARDNARLNRQLRSDQIDAAAAAKAAKQKEIDENTIVRDEKNQPIGRVPTGRGGAQGFATRDADYGRAEQQLQALLDDIEKHGDRVFTPANVRRRQTLQENAKIGVATVSPLGKTNEAMEAEGASIGEHGVAMSMLAGANPEAIKRKLSEIKEQRNRYRQETLRPLDENGVPESAPPAREAPTAKTPASVPAAAAGGSAPPPALVDKAWQAVQDPKAPPAVKQKAVEVLTAAGML